MNLKKTWEELPPLVKTGALIGGGYIAYRLIKKIISKPTPAALPQGGTGLPVTGYTSAGSPVVWNPAPLAKDLYNAMSGLFTLSGTKDEVWRKLAELPSNDMVTAVYNEFNRTYGGGETLTQWIKDEYWYDIAGSGKDMALQRLGALNLI